MRCLSSDKPCDAAFETICPARHAEGVLRNDGSKMAGHPQRRAVLPWKNHAIHHSPGGLTPPFSMTNGAVVNRTG
jgi:hypothetical protein